RVARGRVATGRTGFAAALAAIVTGGVPAGITVGVTGGVPAGITVGVTAGVTGGNGPTPARVPGGLRTAVAHAPLSALRQPRRPAHATSPKSLPHAAPAPTPPPR